MLVKAAKYANKSMVLLAFQPLLVMKTSLQAQRGFYEIKQDQWNFNTSLLCVWSVCVGCVFGIEEQSFEYVKV